MRDSFIFLKTGLIISSTIQLEKEKKMNNERKILEVLVIINEEIRKLTKDNERMSESIEKLTKGGEQRSKSIEKLTKDGEQRSKSIAQLDERMSKSIAGLVKNDTKRAAEIGLLLEISQKQQNQLNNFGVQLEDIKVRLKKIEGNSTQILENQKKQIGF